MIATSSDDRKQSLVIQFHSQPSGLHGGDWLNATCHGHKLASKDLFWRIISNDDLVKIPEDQHLVKINNFTDLFWRIISDDDLVKIPKEQHLVKINDSTGEFKSVVLFTFHSNFTAVASCQNTGPCYNALSVLSLKLSRILNKTRLACLTKDVDAHMLVTFLIFSKVPIALSKRIIMASE
ncbi:hypothetical protein PoB_007354000 [Plakobranchus ocellatus]|uniref:Uncharacterized protein n=1 Tax=Plakobranchus ocellatus TaxID=259542 RepID=A0AAV4DSB1_9GAST|nr:hypothetical protein PoB_007354000 [Plakobranchus ocellatus]